MCQISNVHLHAWQNKSAENWFAGLTNEQSANSKSPLVKVAKRGLKKTVLNIPSKAYLHHTITE